MKYLDDALVERLLRRVQEPWYLVDITLDQEHHYTTGPAATINGVDYLPGHVTGLTMGADGCVLQVLNEGNQHTMPALRGAYQRNPVSVRLAEMPEALYEDQDGNYYLDQAGTPYEAASGVPGIHLLSGTISSIPVVNEWISVMVERTTGRRFPSQRIVPPMANHTRPEGTVIPINQSTYRILTRSRRA